VQLPHVSRVFAHIVDMVDRDHHCTGAAFTSKREPYMDWDRIEGNWKQVKASVKEKWVKPTDDNLDTIAGKRDRLAKINEWEKMQK
jgi:uncharacterized protein YjbJ (UPF0337 family)